MLLPELVHQNAHVIRSLACLNLSMTPINGRMKFKLFMGTHQVSLLKKAVLWASHLHMRFYSHWALHTSGVFRPFHTSMVLVPLTADCVLVVLAYHINAVRGLQVPYRRTSTLHWVQGDLNSLLVVRFTSTTDIRVMLRISLCYNSASPWLISLKKLSSSVSVLQKGIYTNKTPAQFPSNPDEY